MHIMLEAIWPSLRTYPNAIPQSVGTTSNRMIAYFVFWGSEVSPYVSVVGTCLLYPFLRDTATAQFHY
jgi:cytosine/uracil/thiamine/allantoin permease